MPSQQLSWPKLYHLALEHGVSVPLETNLGEQLPDPTREQLQAFNRTLSAHNLRLTAELLRILKAANEQNLTLIPYKGPVLSQMLHGVPTYRYSVDLDLVVRPEEVPSAVALLLALGYRPKWPNASLESFLRFHYEYQLFHPEKAVAVELKWDFAPRRWFSLPPESGWWDRLDSIDFGGLEIRQFATEDYLHILSLHGCKHRWSKLKWLFDVVYLLEKCPVDLAATRARASRQGHGPALDLALALAARISSAERVRASERADEVLAALADSTPLGRHFDLKLRPSLLSKLEYLARTCIDPTVDDLVSVRLPARLHSLYYLVRPMILLKKALPA